MTKNNTALTESMSELPDIREPDSGDAADGEVHGHAVPGPKEHYNDTWGAVTGGEAAAEPAEGKGAVTGADEAANNGGEGDEGEGNDAGDDADEEYGDSHAAAGLGYADRHSSAAVKIQSRVRGSQVRARGRGAGGGEGGGGGGRREDHVAVEEQDALAYDDRHSSAAVKIQSRVRGSQVRARGRGGEGGGGGSGGGGGGGGGGRGGDDNGISLKLSGCGLDDRNGVFAPVCHVFVGLCCSLVCLFCLYSRCLCPL